MKVVRFNSVPAGYYRNYYCEQAQNEIKAHIEDKDENVVISIALPGFSKDNLDIKVEEDMLTIASKEEKESYFTPKTFEKKYKLSNKIDSEAISASFENGILSLTLPRKEEAKKKSLSISIS
jgi:HSP20 family protein